MRGWLNLGNECDIIQASYVTLGEQLKKLGWQTVNGILLDLGLSSMQLDTPHRGFSFLQDAPLDMRFDPRSPISAADLVNTLSEAELAQILYRYGEDPRAPRIAQALVKARPITRTLELAEIVARVIGKAGSSKSRGQRPRSRTHPATRTFQALRIAVNRELEFLRESPSASGRGSRARRKVGGDFFSLAGGPYCETIYSPGEPGLYLSTPTAGMHLWTPGESGRSHSPSAPSSIGGGPNQPTGTQRPSAGCRKNRLVGIAINRKVASQKYRFGT